MGKIILSIIMGILILGVIGITDSAWATNLGISGLITTMEGDIAVISVHEFIEGADLNGDGDLFDTVPHVYDATTSVVTNTGVGISFSFINHNNVNGNLVAFPVSEFDQGVDLNGDGDTNDRVIHVYDATTGITTNLGLASFSVDTGDNFVAFPVFESDHGDLNGDTDTTDIVMHVYDATTGVINNLGLAGSSFLAKGNLVAFPVSESSQGIDLNGDGDTNDSVLHVYDATTGLTDNLGLDNAGFEIYGNFVALSVSEVRHGADLNGDADTDDNVLHVYDATTGLTDNLGLASNVSNHGSTAEVNGNLVEFYVSESKQNADLNGDGDTDDTVPHVYDATTGITTNLGLSTLSFTLLANGNLALFSIHEATQGADLNGDGDTDDTVPHVYDATTGITTNLGLDSNTTPGYSDGTLVMFPISESGQNADLNGDGDQLDTVPHVYDATTGITTNLGIGDFSNVVDGNIIAGSLSEYFEGDLNGDGDTNDTIIHIYDATTTTVTNLGLDGGQVRTNGVTLVYVVSEFNQGVDLNGDGDTNDQVLHASAINPTGPPTNPGNGNGNSNPPANPGPPTETPGNGQPPANPGPPSGKGKP